MCGGWAGLHLAPRELGVPALLHVGADLTPLAVPAAQLLGVRQEDAEALRKRIVLVRV